MTEPEPEARPRTTTERVRAIVPEAYRKDFETRPVARRARRMKGEAASLRSSQYRDVLLYHENQQYVFEGPETKILHLLHLIETVAHASSHTEENELFRLASR